MNNYFVIAKILEEPVLEIFNEEFVLVTTQVLIPQSSELYYKEEFETIEVVLLDEAANFYASSYQKDDYVSIEGFTIVTDVHSQDVLLSLTQTVRNVLLFAYEVLPILLIDDED